MGQDKDQRDQRDQTLRLGSGPTGDGRDAGRYSGCQPTATDLLLSDCLDAQEATKGKDLRVRSVEDLERIALGLGECCHCHNSEPYINDAPDTDDDGDAAVIYQVECIMCGMSSPWCDTPEEAAAVWERMQIGAEPTGSDAISEPSRGAASPGGNGAVVRVSLGGPALRFLGKMSLALGESMTVGNGQAVRRWAESLCSQDGDVEEIVDFINTFSAACQACVGEDAGLSTGLKDADPSAGLGDCIAPSGERG